MDLKAVKPKAKVVAEAKRFGRSVHFGSLMELCHIKNSQLGKKFWTYKGRLVFRGDIVKDENGSICSFHRAMRFSVPHGRGKVYGCMQYGLILKLL